MKILWLSPTPSHPQSAGNRAHIHAMGRHIMAAGHEVTFLLYGQETFDDAAVSEMRSFWNHMMVVPHRIKNRKQSKGKYWGIDDWFNDDIASAVKFLQTQTKFDVVFCEYVFLSKALTYFPKDTLKILNCHDRMSGRAEMLLQNGVKPDFFYTTESEESIALSRADVVLAIQGEEKAFFQSLTSTPVIEVGYLAGLDQVELPKHAPGLSPLRVGYLASNNSLNRKSLTTLCTELTKLSVNGDQLRLIVAGSVGQCLPPGAFDFVDVLGYVEDERGFYASVDLIVNPMVGGTGLKIKSVDALRYGKGLVSTAAGSAGLPVLHPAHSLASVSDLAKTLLKLTTNHAEIDEIVDASQGLYAKYAEDLRNQRDALLSIIDARSAKALRRRRVLIVTDIPFWEQSLGSHARILQLCRNLTSTFDLKVFFLGSIWAERAEAIKAAGLEKNIVSYKNYEVGGDAKSTFPAPPGLSKWRSEANFRAFKKFLSSEAHFDAIIFEYIWLGYLADAAPEDSLTVMDTMDIMALREYRFAQFGMATNVSISLEEELSILQRFDALMAIQKEEAAILRALLPNKIVLTCPHGVEASIESDLATLNPHQGPLRLGFVGGDISANVEGVRWFIENVWPMIDSSRVRLHVFGNVCNQLGNVPAGIELRGFVESADLIYEDCDVMVNPVLQGGGLKIKSVEALAHGKPLIASPEAAAGIEKSPECGVLVAKSRKGFVLAIERLLNDRGYLIELSRNAATYAKAEFSGREAHKHLFEFIADAS